MVKFQIVFSNYNPRKRLTGVLNTFLNYQNIIIVYFLVISRLLFIIDVIIFNNGINVIVAIIGLNIITFIVTNINVLTVIITIVIIIIDINC